MAKILASLLIAASAFLAFRGFGVWVHCGYDCQALPYFNFTATFALIVAMLLAIVGLSIALGKWLSSVARGD